MSHAPAEAPYHGLFLPEDGLNPDFSPEPIGRIYVRRFESTGAVNVPAWFSPDALREPADVFARWGGGSYEVVARRANGSIYAKRLLQLPGPSKAIADPTIADAPSAPSAPPLPSAPTPTGLDPTLAIVLQMSQQQSQMMLGVFSTIGTIMAAAIGKPAANAPSSTPAEMMAAMAQMMTATRPPAPAAPTPLAEVLALQSAIDDAASARSTAAASIARSTVPEESTADTIRAIAEVAGPLLMSLPRPSVGAVASTVAAIAPKLGA